LSSAPEVTRALAVCVLLALLSASCDDALVFVGERLASDAGSAAGEAEVDVDVDAGPADDAAADRPGLVDARLVDARPLDAARSLQDAHQDWPVGDTPRTCQSDLDCWGDTRWPYCYTWPKSSAFAGYGICFSCRNGAGCTSDEFCASPSPEFTTGGCVLLPDRDHLDGGKPDGWTPAPHSGP
jgi:hypothetical protein